MKSAATDPACVPVSEALIAQWRERFEADGSQVQLDPLFASVETALVLDPGVASNLSHLLRRTRICLPVLGGGKEYQFFEVKGSDLQGWGVFEPKGEFVQVADWYPVIRGLESAGLLKDKGRWSERDETRDPRLPEIPPRRQVRLLPVPLETDRRRGKPQERSNATLREGIATFKVPAGVFSGTRLAELGPVDFMTLMAIYAVTDMGTYGGADPSHFRVEDDCFFVSDIVTRSVPAPAAEVAVSVALLEELGFVRLVPAALQPIRLPSARPTFEVVDGDCDQSALVICPCILSRGDGTRLEGAVRDPEEHGAPIVVDLRSEWPLRLAVSMKTDLPEIPQYGSEAHGSLFSDRAVQSLKMRVARAIPDVRLHRSHIQLGFADDERRLGLVHLAKATIDAMRGSKTITGDSKYVVEQLDIRREDTRKDRGAHISIGVHDLDVDVRFSRRLYVGALEWRPPARRGPSHLSAPWTTYSAYIEALEDAVSTLPNDVAPLSQVPLELVVNVSAPSDRRFDPDNVALFGCDLLTLVLNRREPTIPVDQLVDRVLVTHQEGEPSVTLEIRPLSNS